MRLKYKKRKIYSTETTRIKGKYVAKNEQIGINITHPKGGPYVSIYGKAKIRRENDFKDYKEVISLILERYVKPSEKEEQLNNILKNKNRILVEINPVRIISPKVVW